jgi:hypothetical protein
VDVCQRKTKIQKKGVDLSTKKHYDLSSDDIQDFMRLLSIKGHISGGSWDSMSGTTKWLFVYEMVSLYYEGKSSNVPDTSNTGS